MRIANNYSSAAGQAVQAPKVAPPKPEGTSDAGSPAAAEAGGAATVTLSSKALELAASHGEASDVDSPKVARLKAQVSSGQLTIDTQKIGQRIADGD